MTEKYCFQARHAAKWRISRRLIMTTPIRGGYEGASFPFSLFSLHIYIRIDRHNQIIELRLLLFIFLLTYISLWDEQPSQKWLVIHHRCVKENNLRLSLPSISPREFTGKWWFLSYPLGNEGNVNECMSRHKKGRKTKTKKKKILTIHFPFVPRFKLNRKIWNDFIQDECEWKKFPY